MHSCGNIATQGCSWPNFWPNLASFSHLVYRDGLGVADVRPDSVHGGLVRHVHAQNERRADDAPSTLPHNNSAAKVKFTGLAQNLRQLLDSTLIGMFSQTAAPACKFWPNPVHECQVAIEQRLATQRVSTRFAGAWLTKWERDSAAASGPSRLPHCSMSGYAPTRARQALNTPRGWC
jgi:hypothetical protein